MALHPEQRKRHFPEEAPVARDPIRRALEENEDWYRDLVEHSQDLLCVHDMEGRLLSVNPVPARLLGYSVEEILERRLQDIIDPQFREQVDAYLREIEHSGESRGLMAVVTRSGERRIWEYHNTLRTEGVARPIVRGMAHDVTERVRAEKALRASHEQLLKTAREQERTLHELTLFRTLLDQSNDAIEVVDPGTLRFLDVNERACVELGYSREELLSMTVADIDLDYDESSRERVEQRLRESGFAIMERVHRRKDGMTFPVEVNLRRVRLDREYGVAVSRDITARKRAEEALRESELRFRTVYERSPIGIALVDSHSGRFLQVNPKFCEIAGREEEELLRTDVASITHPDDMGHTRECLQQLCEEKLANYEMDKRYLRPDGSARWVRILAVPMWGKGEKSRWHMGLVEDITERKRTEEALRQSEERFRVALKNSPIAVFNQDRNLRYTWMYNSQLPLADSEKLGKTVSEIFDPEEVVRMTEVRRRVLETRVGARDEIQITCGGKRYYLNTTIEPVLDSAGAVIGLTGASMDVTELREASEALREAQRKLTEEKLYLKQEIDTELGFGEIIGQSKVLQAVKEQVGKVASSDATVLLLGETGTGKELVARAIHRLGRRADR